MELQYKWLGNLSQYYSCQDSEFQFRDPHQLIILLLWFRKNRFLCMQCPKISWFFFLIQRWCRPKDGEFFFLAKFAHFITRCEWLYFFDDLPSDVEVDVVVVFF